MKVKFLKDCQLRDPKTLQVISSFKKNQICDLTVAGAQYFIAAGDAEALAAENLDVGVQDPIVEVVSSSEKPVETRRSRT